MESESGAILWQPRSETTDDVPVDSLVPAAPPAPLAPQTKEKAKSMLNLQFSLGPGNMKYHTVTPSLVPPKHSVWTCEKFYEILTSTNVSEHIHALLSTESNPSLPPNINNLQLQLVHYLISLPCLGHGDYDKEAAT